MVNIREDFYKIIDQKRYLLCAEIGVQKGIFSSCLAKSLMLQNLFLVDPYQHFQNYLDIANVSQEQHDVLYEQVKNKFKDDKRIVLMRKTSLEAAELFSENQLDFVYLDANHSYEEVKKDIKAWYPKIKQNGCLAGHDYIDGNLPEGNFGVKTAVNEFANNNNLRLFITKEFQWKSWFFFK